MRINYGERDRGARSMKRPMGATNWCGGWRKVSDSLPCGGGVVGVEPRRFVYEGRGGGGSQVHIVAKGPTWALAVCSRLQVKWLWRYGRL